MKIDEAKTTQEKKTVHRSVSFTPEDYAELERIAKKKNVSVAWVVREAVANYISEQTPLFNRLA